ncbi:hypothetical protein PGT21_014274 [Puccinia graminis f. sp. tritici]|uniref:Uncharacterized protein n=1 Tax=Puccinia graminis f. sp. tritici TaxID=56615 RepID=A0A5B0LNH7_PUCGR|nr:hypothetical protein PGTUg99_014013 [Puccinia graminis f. sp. tritici]KAA1090807.1 hypothetical protein PGT21_014274 [Puccinia graminis f. sp. tritici]
MWIPDSDRPFGCNFTGIKPSDKRTAEVLEAIGPLDHAVKRLWFSLLKCRTIDSDGLGRGLITEIRPGRPTRRDLGVSSRQSFTDDPSTACIFIDRSRRVEGKSQEIVACTTTIQSSGWLYPYALSLPDPLLWNFFLTRELLAALLHLLWLDSEILDTWLAPEVGRCRPPGISASPIPFPGLWSLWTIHPFPSSRT